MQVTEFLVAFGSLADAGNSFISLRFYSVMESRCLQYSLNALSFPGGVCWKDLFVSYSASFLSVSFCFRNFWSDVYFLLSGWFRLGFFPVFPEFGVAS